MPFYNIVFFTFSAKSNNFWRFVFFLFPKKLLTVYWSKEDLKSTTTICFSMKVLQFSVMYKKINCYLKSIIL